MYMYTHAVVDMKKKKEVVPVDRHLVGPFLYK